MSRVSSMVTVSSMLLWVSIVAVDAQPVRRTVTVQDPRPVAKAAERLEDLYGIPITYEDQPYVYSGEMIDVTDQVRRASQGQATTNANRIMIPRGGSLSFSYYEQQAASSTGRDIEALKPMIVREATHSMLTGFGLIGRADMFALEQAGAVLHVVPTHFINSEGQVEPLTPLLDTPVTISARQRSGAELVGEICRSLSVATRQTVVVGTVPASLLATRITAVSASNEKARGVLDRLFKDIDVPLSWQLFYDPSLQWYVLNIHVVAALGNQ